MQVNEKNVLMCQYADSEKIFNHFNLFNYFHRLSLCYKFELYLLSNSLNIIVSTSFVYFPGNKIKTKDFLDVLREI